MRFIIPKVIGYTMGATAKARYHVSLSIMIPFIFTGLSILSLIVSYFITIYCILSGSEAIWPLWLWGMVIGSLTFLCGSLIAWMVLKPVKQFIKQAEGMPILAEAIPHQKPYKSADELDHFSDIFQHITYILSSVKARELFPEIICESRSLRSVFSLIMKAAPTDSTILITGESGTGKELIATAIHEHSHRKGKPFVKLNCIAIPDNLLESELFGHEKGAFTGATSLKRGKFEVADGGTILLDEIGDMPLSTQGKLLRVLQEREFEHVGGTRPIRVNIRVIASSNKNLAKMVTDGQFREDLYYRLNVISLYLPPLRERKEDIPLLVEHFLEKSSRTVSLSPAALEMLNSYSWPGNVRELQNMIERATIVAEDTIEPSHLLPHHIMVGQCTQLKQPDIPSNSSMDDYLNTIEKGMLIEALKKAGGVQARAAELLGINQRSLWHRVKKYGIEIAAFK